MAVPVHEVCPNRTNRIVVHYTTDELEFGSVSGASQESIDAWFAKHPNCSPVPPPKPNPNRKVVVFYDPNWGDYVVHFSDDPKKAVKVSTIEKALFAAKRDVLANGGKVVIVRQNLKFVVRAA